MMKRTLRTAIAALLSVGILAGSVLTSSAAFTDVPSTHWAYTYVQKASDNGLVSGVGNGLYGVDNQLSAADFATMVCALLYPGEADALKGKSSYWWYPYMETAYVKGLLTGTTAGDSRSSLGAWRSDVPTQKLTRYDLAQIIYNAQKLQGWPEPNSNFIYIYMAAIPDWSQIPAKYQTAVVMAYAGGFLTGMDDKGTFKGDEVMTRGQAAVVLCAMLDAAKEQSSPTYTNRAGKLVNGEDATEENVQDALQELRYEFYEYYIWDTQRSYTSAKLGTGVGGGILIENGVYAGFNFAAAELGHIVIDYAGIPCACGRKGCWEQYSSATALTRQTKDKMRECPDSLMWELCGGDRRAAELKFAYTDGYAYIRTALEERSAGKPMTAFEKAADDYALESMDDVRYAAHGKIPAVLYYLYKTAEIKNLRTIMALKLISCPAEEIKRRLRKGYVG